MIHKDLRCDRGNVLFLILLAVALFAALSYAVTKSSSVTSSSTGNETVALDVGEYQQQFASWSAAIQRMRFTSNCADDEVSVANSRLSTFYASASGKRNPPRPECVLFSPTGGGATYNTPKTTFNGGRNIAFYANFGITDVADVYSELIAILPTVSQEFCQKYNEKLGLGSTIPEYTAGAFNFTTAYAGPTGLAAGSYTWGIAGRCPECRGRPAFCVRFTNTVSFVNVESSAFPAGYYAFYAIWER